MSEPGQLALFELAHEHVFERWQGPHLVFPPLTMVIKADPYLFHYDEVVQRWCLGCGEYVDFVKGVEVPRKGRI